MNAPDARFRVCSLASGSSGNVCYVECGDTRVLVDAGLSAKKVRQALVERGLDAGDFHALLISHKHADHIGNAGPVARRFDMPIYATAGSLRGRRERIGTVTGMHTVEAGVSFAVGNLTITPVALPHDAPQTVGYLFEGAGRRFAIFTDLGHVSVNVARIFGTLDACLLETNHDLDMLRDGSYPEELKQRVAGEHGHLSNAAAAALVARHGAPRLQTLIFGHLSAENNDPHLARHVLSEALADRPDLGHVSLSLAPRDLPGEVIEVARAVGIEAVTSGTVKSRGL